MYGELYDNGQGGAEYERDQEERLKDVREQWWRETAGRVSFEDWLDGCLGNEQEEEE